MLALCLMLSSTYYAQNYAGIIGGSLVIELKVHDEPGEDRCNVLCVQWTRSNVNVYVMVTNPLKPHVCKLYITIQGNY